MIQNYYLAIIKRIYKSGGLYILREGIRLEKLKSLFKFNKSKNRKDKQKRPIKEERVKIRITRLKVRNILIIAFW